MLRLLWKGARTSTIRYFVIKVVASFGTDIDYHVNSHRLERSRTVRPLHPAQDPTPITVEERWSDVRLSNGRLYPFAHSIWNLDTQTRLSWLDVHQIESISDIAAGYFNT